MTAANSVDECLERAATEFGTPAYVYFTDAIERRIDELRVAFGARFALSYAAKSNPNPGLLHWLKNHVELLDVSSIGEFRLGLGAGWDASRLSFTGPGKREYELREAIECGCGELVLESVREAVAADHIARSKGRVQDVMIRIAPSRVPKGFGDQMAGRPSAFGIDIETAPTEVADILELANLNVVGLHIYSGTQCLKPDALCENYRIFLDIFKDVCRRHSLRPSKLVFGSGLGIPYHDTDTALDLGAVARGVVDDLDAMKADPIFAETQLILELGRYLVGEAGYFLTRVISVKNSRGRRIGICDGGMNNHLPASGHFGMVIHRNYSMHRVGGGTATETIDLVGPLCTSIDRLASGVLLPRVEEGALIAIHNSGSYGLTASPIHFISHQHPREILVGSGDMRDVTYINA
ncbi:MAG: type III PLP-dependent enzyme [Hyphomicrobium sp.]